MPMNKQLDDVRRDAIMNLKHMKEDEEPFFYSVNQVYNHTLTMEDVGRRGIAEEFEKVPEDILMYELMKQAVDLINDGYKEEALIEMLTTEYWKRDVMGTKAVLAYIYIRMAVYMVTGMKWNERTQVLAILPEEMKTRFWAYRDEQAIAEKDALEQFRIEYIQNYSRPKITGETILEDLAQLEDEVLSLEPKMIKLFLENVDKESLMACTAFFEHDTKEFLLEQIEDEEDRMVKTFEWSVGAKEFGERKVRCSINVVAQEILRLKREID